MWTPGSYRSWIVGFIRQSATAALMAGFLIIVFSAQAAQAQTYSVIHRFTGGSDGASPFAGLTVDATGNLYGTTLNGGSGFGTVFSVKPSGSNWVVAPIYEFKGGSDGAGPVARVVIGPNGSLYGSTSAGGGGSCPTHNAYTGCGTVFSLSPSVGLCLGSGCAWNETVLHRFHGGDGSYPQGDLAFDRHGVVFGTTVNGGLTGIGTVYSLASNGSGTWLQNVILNLLGSQEGAYPWGGVAFDQEGNMYGVLAHNGPAGYGTIYKLTHSGLGWIETNLHGFTYGNDGAIPQGGLTVDPAGNVFGTTIYGGSGSGGIAFEETNSGGHWTHKVLHSFSGGIGLGSYDKMAMDSAGNLYGTTFGDGAYNSGTVFELVHSQGGWTYNLLHTFAGGSDGAYPFSTLAIDGNGNLYGTTSSGGINNQGVIFEITASRRN